MRWVKKGFIYSAKGESIWNKTSAMIPCPVILDESTVRVFLTFQDDLGIGRPGFIDLNLTNLKTIKKVSENPMFDIGLPGTFDDNGAVVCSVVKKDDQNYYFYYVGFELCTKIRYRLLTGLAVTDSKFNLKKKFKTPVLERSESEMFFRCGPFCMIESGVYKMWYIAGSEWTITEGKELPVYQIYYIESEDGINWPEKGQLCISIENDGEHGFGRPYVILQKDIYKMFYSIRLKGKGYRLGYAESNDGKEWVRKDELMNLDISKYGFDSEMICFSAVIEIKNKLIMFYNGNKFGKDGLGYAVLE